MTRSRAIGESLHPVDEWSGIELRDIDTAKIATLHSLLTGDLFDEAVARYEPIYVSAAEGALVLRLADEVTERLAELDEESIDEVAAELRGPRSSNPKIGRRKRSPRCSPICPNSPASPIRKVRRCSSGCTRCAPERSEFHGPRPERLR